MKPNYTNFLPGLLICFVLSLSIAIPLNAQTSSVSGKVSYHYDTTKLMSGVNVILKDTNNSTIDSVTTGADGKFLFTGIAYGTYVLEANTNQQSGGTDLGDSFLIMMHLFGFYPFNDIEEGAADVDGDGEVTWNDYWTIVIGWFIQGYPFPGGEWYFESKTIEVTASRDNEDDELGGSSLSDVNGSFEPGTKQYSQSILSPGQDIQANADTEYELELKTTESISSNAMFLNIQYPGELISIVDIKAPFSSLNYDIQDNTIKISAVNNDTKGIYLGADENILVLTVKTKKSFLNGLEAAFSLEDDSHIIDTRGNIIEDFRLKGNTLIASDFSLQLGQNYPNPCDAFTSIEFSLDQDSKISISIYNAQGQMIKTMNLGMLSKGMHKQNIFTQDIVNGMYFYKLNKRNGESMCQTKKMKVIH